MVKTDLIKFTIKDSYKIINKLSRFYSKDIVSKWEKKVVKDINELLKKYKVKQFKVNENSYMGIVIDCLLLDNNSIFIKIIPPMINRFEAEVESLKLFPKSITSKIYEVDYEKNAIIMEKIIPGTLVEFYENKEKYTSYLNRFMKTK